jgi:hypothetical protein
MPLTGFYRGQNGSEKRWIKKKKPCKKDEKKKQ